MDVIEKIKERCDISVAITHILSRCELAERAYKEGKLRRFQLDKV